VKEKGNFDRKEKKWKYGRRDFIRVAGAAGLAVYGLGFAGCKSGFSRTLELGPRQGKKENRIKEGIYAARGGDDPYKLTVAAVAAAGGMAALVSKGDTVVVKPNIAWDRTVEQAANTNPMVVSALVHMALDAGAAKVKVFDRPCNKAQRTYNRSGIAEAAEKAGAEVFFVENDAFATVTIPGGQVLKEWELSRDALEADVFINAPIVKHHGATGMTAGMKNLMGTAGGNRGAWHVGKLDQRIADIQSAIRPDLVVIDAFRILKNHGPQGGSLDDVEQASTVAVSRDIVAADAYAAKIFGADPYRIDHIRFGAEMGYGQIDLTKVKLEEQPVS